MKRRMVFYNPEPNYWMVMVRALAETGRGPLLLVLSVRALSPVGRGLQYIDQAHVKRASKDEREVIEYLDHELQDSVLDATIRQVYKMFRVWRPQRANVGRREPANPPPVPGIAVTSPAVPRHV